MQHFPHPNPKHRKRPALALFIAALGLGACDENNANTNTKNPAPPSKDRSNAVLASSAKPAASPPSASAASNSPAPVNTAPRKLCAEPLKRPAPKGRLQTAVAPNESAPTPSIPFGVGKWVWVNLWAAWCKPCKEEMPRLLEWQKKLSAGGVLIELAFISLDDDERQLHRFLEAQPQGGVRASYWLSEGTGRSSWLSALGVKENVDLPVHALFAPSGDLSCIIQGAVEERDYGALAAYFGAKP